MEFVGLATMIFGGVHCLVSTPKSPTQDPHLHWARPYKYIQNHPMLLQHITYLLHLIHPVTTTQQRRNMIGAIGSSLNVIIKLEKKSEQWSNTENHHQLWGFNYEVQKRLHVMTKSLQLVTQKHSQTNSELSDTIANIVKIAEDMVHNISQNVYYA